MQLDLRDAARFLGVEESKVYRWVRRGDLPAQRVHEQYQVDRVDLLEFAAARGITVSPELMDEAKAGGPKLPGLAEAVRAGGVHPDVPGEDKPSVLRAVVELLPLPPRIERNFLLQMLLAREQLGSTGLGGGIALPHPRNPVILRVAAPAVAVCYLASPVEFGALDGQPVHTLFTLISPSVRVHLHLLALLATALRDRAVMEQVRARAPEGELVEAIARVEAGLPGPSTTPPGRKA